MSSGGAITDFAALYRRHAPEVYRFAYFLSGSRSGAEDITSETFVHAWAAAARIETATVKGYLLAIARNVYRKGAARRQRHVSLPDDLRDRASDPAAVIEARSSLAAVDARLAALPDVDRAALLMRTLEDLSYEEIARALGITVAAARVKVHRTRAALAGLR